MTYSLRLFVEHEWKKLRDIRLEGLKNYPNMLGQPYEEAKAFLKEDWLRWITDPYRGYFGIYSNDDLIGFYFIRIFEEDLTQARMNGLYIKREHHWKGLDALLFKTTVAWAKEMNCTSLRAGCKEDNHSSRRLIEKYGGIFIKKDDEIFHYPDGSKGYTLWYKVDLQ